VLIADGLAADGLAKLREIPGVELLEYSAIERADLKDRIHSTDVLVVRSRTQVDRDLLAAAPNLKLVLRAGIGLDNIDVPVATELGIPVMNAPTGNIVTTAEHALALIFAVSRHVAQADATLRKGKWEKKKFQGNELRGKTLALIGLGNIGKAVAERAIGLSMKVVGYDPYLSAEAAAKHRISLLSFEECLKQADYLSVHVPMTPATKNLIGRDQLAQLKKTAYVVNCARGGIVDEGALIEALDKGLIAGAALDVFEHEPLPADHPLLGRTNTVLTPHLGASTDEAQIQVGLEVAEQIRLFVEKGVLKNAINVPNVSVEQNEVLKPYVNLCERLGAFASQIASGGVERIRVRYEGTVSGVNREVLTLSVLKGFLTPLMSTPVNFVNAKNLMRERGIRVEESFDAQCADYASLVEIVVEGKESTAVAGTLFGKAEPRIVRIDNYAIDAIPTGSLLFTRNVDQPGVIGALGSTLGTAGINIARMHLGRDQEKSRAIALINLDAEVSPKALELLKQVSGMISVQPIRL